MEGLQFLQSTRLVQPRAMELFFWCYLLKGKFLHITLAALHACIYHWDNRLFDLLFCSVLCASVSSGNELCCDVKQKWISPPEGRKFFGYLAWRKCVTHPPTYLPWGLAWLSVTWPIDLPTYPGNRQKVRYVFWAWSLISLSDLKSHLQTRAGKWKGDGISRTLWFSG